MATSRSRQDIPHHGLTGRHLLLLIRRLDEPDGEHGDGPDYGRDASRQKGRSVVTDIVVDVPGHWRSNSERDGAQSQQEADRLTCSFGSTEVEGDGSEHCDETSVKYAQDETEGDQGLQQRGVRSGGQEQE